MTEIASSEQQQPQPPPPGMPTTSVLQLPSPAVSVHDFSSSAMDGYADNQFEGKAEQMAQVAAYIAERGFIPENLLETEVAWFYNNLGIDNMYFSLESVDVIANHIMALYSAKMTAYLKSASSLEIDLEQEREDGAVYIHSSKPGVSIVDGPQYEQRIDQRYLGVSCRDKAFRLETYRSSGVVASNFKTQLRCYFVQQCKFAVSEPTEEEERDISKVSDTTFISKATSNTLDIYQRVMNAVLERMGPVIEMHEVENSRCKRLVVGYRQGSAQQFFSAMSDLYHYYDLYSTRKYVENFSNGVTIMCIYLSPLLNTTAPPIEHSILQIMREASLIYCLPTTALQALFKSGTLSVQETIYGYAGLAFAQHFLNRLGPEYSTLVTLLDGGADSRTNPIHVEVLSKIKKRLRQETFTREYVLDIVRQYPELIRILYVNFAMRHYTMHQRENSLKPSLSFQRLQKDRPLSTTEIQERIRKTVCNSHEQMVFEALLTFNQHILKTNFYTPTKVALSFRLDPSFLPELEYPTRPFGMFLVIGGEFRGFHVRFRDIARGGIRIIRSRNREAYSINLRTLFDENYALALTQQRKNKDIPEGGSKGTILLDAGQQDKATVAFQKYVDAIMDLLIVGQTPGIKDKIVDHYGQQEILFFGPDEGSADLMDWASEHARRRGASFWKAFTTGKSQSLGGIPHDVFGMTTRSIHQYVMGIYKKLGLKETECTKFQTGGPDGDLGSNEIKISHDKTIAIVDGSGVIYDPAGLNRDELAHLAMKRRMIANFDVGKLGPGGFRVLVDEHDVTLPDGTVVEDGLKFRNEFHLNPLSSADVFVPCGGRPEAVDINNVSMLMDAEGKPRFKYIVEGANLFFTQDARLRLEQAGAIIFKDASANKGGVTSSSLEVLAALAFNDEEFSKNMQVSAGTVPEFYSLYIEEVHRIIENNAAQEFDCLWSEHVRNPEKAISCLSDELSIAILRLNAELQEANVLWDNVVLRELVLKDALPPLLVERVGGLSVLLRRLPEAYIKALFGSYLASRFVYKHGVTPNQFAFFEFMSSYYGRLPC